MKKSESFDYRLDKRSIKEFEENLKKHTKEEIEYLQYWIDRYNGMYGRKKREFVVLKWGCKDFIEVSLDASSTYKPDFLLAKCYNNSYFVKSIFPIEVTTCAIISKTYYLKKSKVIWDYDNLTPQIATTSHYILFIINTEKKGHELFTILTPKFLDKLKKTNIEYPDCLGNKPAYQFKHDIIKWKKLFPKNFNNLKLF